MGMRDLCRLVGWTVVDLLRSRAMLEAEIWTLRQQINVLRRAVPVVNQSDYIGDAARPGSDGKECVRSAQWCATRARPSLGTNAFVPHCSTSCTTVVRDEDAVRPRRLYDRGIPCGSNRSAVQHIRFAMGSAATLVDHECPLIEVFG